MVACKNKKQDRDNNVSFYPDKAYFEQKKLVKIDIKKQQMNFKNLVDSIDSIYERDSIPFIEIKRKNESKKIAPYRNDYGLFVEKNILVITEDSILKDNNYSLKELNSILLRHYTNNGELPYYSEHYKKASIEISLDTISKSDVLISTLNKVIDEFEVVNSAINDSLTLRIGFSYSRQIPPPPPPPDNN